MDRKKVAVAEASPEWQGVLSELVAVLRRKGLLDESEVASLRDKLTR
jgi:hypothetical protein